MPSHHSIPHRRSRAIRAIAENSGSAADPAAPALTDEAAVLGLMDLDWVDAAFGRLNTAFASPHAVLHAVACKAVPLPSLLRRFADAGAGCEVASPGELELALAAGFTADRIVFDSPAKTWAELRRALDLGVSINIDSFDELTRLDTLLDEQNDGATSAMIGFRINPQSGTGTIGALSTATQTSKFGVGLADPGVREALIEAYLARPWLRQIHVHSGSQGISLDKAAEGIRAAVGLAEEINDRAASGNAAIPESVGSAALPESASSAATAAPTGSTAHPETPDPRQITRIDIGGGLSVNFDGEDVTPTFADYRAVLEAQVPGLFAFDIVTEFGRALLAKAGTILTRVEYAKTTGGRRIAMTHAGVQVATRTAYAPADWPLRILAFTPDGRPKLAEAARPDPDAGPGAAPEAAHSLLEAAHARPEDGRSLAEAAHVEPVPTDVAGPACFSGDLLARDQLLPRLDVGDLVAVPETGAYYFSNPFSYNLLPRVPIFGFRTAADGTTEFFLIRRGQTITEILAESGEAELRTLSPVAAPSGG